MISTANYGFFLLLSAQLFCQLCAVNKFLRMTEILLRVSQTRSGPDKYLFPTSSQQEGERQGLPYNALYGVIPILEWQLLLQTNSTNGKCPSQLPSKSNIHDLSISLSICIVHSDCPLVCGQMAVLKKRQVLRVFQKLDQNLELNCESQLETINTRIP